MIVSVGGIARKRHRGTNRRRACRWRDSARTT